MSDNLNINASVTTDEPEIAADLEQLRFMVLRGKKGDTGDSAYDEAVQLGFEGTEAEWIASLKGVPGEDGVSFVPAYLDEGVVRYANAYGEHDADDIYTASAMKLDINNGILPLISYSPEDYVGDYFELDRSDFRGATRVLYFRSKDYLLSVDSTGAYTLTDRPQGGGNPNAVLYTQQSLSDSQKAQARTNVGAGTYSKPSGGIPKTDLASAVQTSLGKADSAYQKPSGGIPANDLASGVIPSVPQMATQTDMNDWTSGKTVDASAVKTVVSDKQNAPLEIPVTESDGTYSTTATAEQIRAAKENSVFVFDGEMRIKALLWLPWDEGVDLLIGFQMLDSTIVSVSANVSTDRVSIAFEQSPIPTAVSELTNDSGYQTATQVQTAISGVRQLPAVTASDNGKFLRVVNGAWAAETVQTWQGGSY